MRTKAMWAAVRGHVAAQVALACAVLTASGCQPFDDTPPLAAPEELGSVESSLSSTVRRARAEAIRQQAVAVGIWTPVLFAGIGEAETGLAHCNAEVGYGCPGPPSASCGGGAILAGGADGPCSAQQGGLGMFQFDSGTYQDTLNNYGQTVLTFEGNVRAAFEFMIVRVQRSAYIPNVETREEAIAWINSAGVGTGNYPTWIKTVTHYYNGCSPTGCSVYASRYAKYDNSTHRVLAEFGDAFWDVTPAAPPPEAAPEEVPEDPVPDAAPVAETEQPAPLDTQLSAPQPAEPQVGAYTRLDSGKPASVPPLGQAALDADGIYGGIGCSAGGSGAWAIGAVALLGLGRRRRQPSRPR